MRNCQLFEFLEVPFSQPAPVPQSLEEAQQLIGALWQLLAELQKRKTELEEQLNMNSENSPNRRRKTAPSNAPYGHRKN